MSYDWTRELLLKLCLGVMMALVVYLPLSLGAETAYRESAQETLLAFLSVIGAAWASTTTRRARSPLNTLLLSVFLFQAVVHFLRNAQILLWPDSALVLGSAAYMLAESTDVQLILVLLSVGMITRMRVTSPNVAILLAVAAALLAAVTHYLVVTFSLSCLDDFGLNAASSLLALISLSLMLLLVVSVLSDSRGLDGVDRSWLVVGLILLGAASGVMIHDIGAPGSLYGLSMRAAGLLVIVLALAVKAQTLDGIRLFDSHLVPILTSVMALLPYAVILVVEASSPGVLFPNMPAYQLIHAMMSGLCIMMASLIYRYVEGNPTLILYPIAALLAFWGFAHAVVVLASFGPVAAFFGESMYVYVMGGLVSISAFVTAVYWTYRAAAAKLEARPMRWILNLLFVFTVVLCLGALAEQFFVPTEVSGGFDSAARVALLVVSMIAVGVGVHLSYLSVRQKRTWRSLEGLASAFVSVLLIPLILKSVFQDFSAGWWAAELVGLFALLLMPAVVGLLYVEALSGARESERHANLYSDLLMHDISNMHQAALISLSLCEIDGISDAARGAALDEARRSLARAMEIVSNVRSISSARTGNGDPLGPVSLIRAIDTAHQHMLLQVSGEKTDFTMSVPESECLVVADELLPNLFYNLMINAARYSLDVPVIRVEITIGQLRGQHYWETRIIDHGRGIEPARKAKLFERFMDGADGVGLGLAVAHALTHRYGGEIRVDDRVEGDYRKGTAFTVSLPAHVQSSALVMAAGNSTEREVI